MDNGAIKRFISNIWSIKDEMHPCSTCSKVPNILNALPILYLHLTDTWLIKLIRKRKDVEFKRGENVV